MKYYQSEMARAAMLEKMKSLVSACEKIRRDCSRNESGRTTDAEWRRILWLASNIRADVAIMHALREEFAELQRENPVESKVQDATHESDREKIRKIFMKNGFRIKEGKADLEEYVYQAAYGLIEATCIDLQRERAWVESEQ